MEKHARERSENLKFSNLSVKVKPGDELINIKTGEYVMVVDNDNKVVVSDKRSPLYGVMGVISPIAQSLEGLPYKVNGFAHFKLKGSDKPLVTLRVEEPVPIKRRHKRTFSEYVKYGVKVGTILQNVDYPDDYVQVLDMGSKVRTVWYSPKGELVYGMVGSISVASAQRAKTRAKNGFETYGLVGSGKSLVDLEK